MKQLFYDLNLLEEHTNVYIKEYAPKAENIIYKPDRKYESDVSLYFNIIRNNNGNVQLYYRSAAKNINDMFCIYAPFTQYTGYAESNDGISFEKPNLNIVNYLDNTKNNIILKEGMASTNFMVFYDSKTNIYRGIGGGHNDYVSISSKNNHTPKCIKNTKYIDKQMGIFNKPLDPDVEHSCRINGLYQWTSNDGIHWNLVNNKPFINGFHPGGCDRPVNGKYGISPFDGLPSIFYDNLVNEYRLYVRYNPRSNIRNIQYATSKDFVNWSSLKHITFEPPFDLNNDNYYYSSMQPYPDSDQYYTLLPYYHKDRPYQFETYLAFSEDGIHWKRMHKMINKCGYNNVSGLIISNDKTEMYIYLQENYMNKQRKMPRTNVRRYSIRMDGFTSIRCDKNNKGSFMTKKIRLCDFKINHKIYGGGYISINILNRSKDIIASYNVTELDYLEYPITINSNFHNNNGYIQFEMDDAEIYSINFL
jgi:hypothetical protein